MISDTTKRFIDCLSELKKRGKIKSFAQFANESNITKQSLNEILKGRREVPSSMLSILVKKFRVSADYLLSGKGDLIIQEEKSDEIQSNIIMIPEDQIHSYIQWLKNTTEAIPFSVFSIPEIISKRKNYVCLETDKSRLSERELMGDYLLCSTIENSQLRFSITTGEYYVVFSSKEIAVGKAINQLRNEQLLTIQIDQNKNNDLKFKFSEILQVLKVEFVFQSIEDVKKIMKTDESWNQSLKTLEKLLKNSNDKLEKISSALKIF
jgi:transcriptional regulator with XRE-family HTH domain